MQASGSFERVRTGRKRPDNLMAIHPGSPMVPSVSSDDQHAAHLSNTETPIANSGRPLIEEGMPPTPVTASAHSSPRKVRLPSVNHLLKIHQQSFSPRVTSSGAPSLVATLPTPPDSSELHSSPRFNGKQAGLNDEIEQFTGPRPQWLADSNQSSFADVDRPLLRRMFVEKEASGPPPQSAVGAASTTRRVSPRTFQELFSEDREIGITGLGLASSHASSNDDATPRLGSLGSNSLGLMTPTQADYHRIPRIAERAPNAPSMEQEGVFPSTVPSSPIHPPLSNWNTRLDFDATARFSIPEATSSPASAPMQRERPVQVDWGMPMVPGLHGLGISLDGFVDTPADSSAPVQENARMAAEERSLCQELTELAPALGKASISCDSPTITSPPLRNQSKKRSELVRRQAEAAVAADMGRRSPAIMVEGEAERVRASKLAPQKRPLGQVDANVVQRSSNANVKALAKTHKQALSTHSPASPWGVFRLKEEGWKSLNPPGGGKALGSNAVKSSSSVPVDGQAKKQRSSTSLAASRPSSKQDCTVAAAGKKVLAHSYSYSTTAVPSSSSDRRSSNKENLAPSAGTMSFRPSIGTRPASSPSLSGVSSRPSAGRMAFHTSRPAAVPLGVHGNVGGRKALR